MPAYSEPEALLSHLHSGDGSATYSYAGYTVVGAVSGPIEVQRRDELPEEAVVDVVVRPAAGVGGTRERHLEALLQSTLRQIILVTNFPRTLIQITLQVTVAPENEYANTKIAQANTNIPIVPVLMQTAVLSLLSAAIPLSATLASTTLAVVTNDDRADEFVVNPTAREVEKSRSVHVFAYTSNEDLILAESEGEFTMEEWGRLLATARKLCCTPEQTKDVDMNSGTPAGADLATFTRSTLESANAADLYWK